ncbi:MAG: hypothetical protein LBV26_01185 [Bacteroidales bacterium]|nr:hypothetical protein [Bacteroidales bacterium]
MAFLFVALFASYYTCITFHVHTHQYPWGDVTHSHPYSSGSHSHNSCALQCIDNLSDLVIACGGAALSLAILHAAKIIFSAFRRKSTIYFLIESNLLRGPPLKAQHTCNAYPAPAKRP